MKPIRILFVDDHKLFRESVVRLLDREQDFAIVAQCGTLSEAERIVRTTTVDLMLLDYDLGTEIGTTVLTSAFRVQPDMRVLMVTGGMGRSAIRTGAEAGVSGIVLKHSDPERLIEAIRRVSSGETWWDSAVIQTMTGAGNDLHSHASLTITNRQREILHFILDGLTNKEIASKTSSTESAVKASIQELFAKAGVRTRSQLVRIAVENHTSDWLKRKE